MFINICCENKWKVLLGIIVIILEFEGILEYFYVIEENMEV